MGGLGSQDEAVGRAADIQRRLVRAELALRSLRRERDACVYAAVREGASYRDLAAALGISKQTVMNIVRKHEPVRKEWPPRPWFFAERRAGSP